MKRVISAGLGLALLLLGSCASTEQAEGMAEKAYERAGSAYALAEEQQQRVNLLEQRLSYLEGELL